MALHEKTQSNSKFLLVKHNSIILESKEPIEGYDPIVVRNPRTNEDITKYIKRFAAVDGIIRKIEWYDSGDTYENRFMGLKIHLRDKGEYYQLDLPFNSRPYDSFTKLVENIDFEKPVEFSAWEDKRTKKTAFAVRQDTVPVKWKYTMNEYSDIPREGFEKREIKGSTVYVKNNMGECPEPVKDELGAWDFRAQKIWLLKRMRENVIPKVDALNEFDEPEPEYSGVEEEPIQQSREAPGDPFDDEAMHRVSDPPPDDSDIPFSFIIGMVGLGVSASIFVSTVV